jgi:hypothetical protein
MLAEIDERSPQETGRLFVTALGAPNHAEATMDVSTAFREPSFLEEPGSELQLGFRFVVFAQPERGERAIFARVAFQYRPFAFLAQAYALIKPTGGLLPLVACQRDLAQMVVHFRHAALVAMRSDISKSF